MTRHLLTLGRVPRPLVRTAAELWRADKIDGPLRESELVLVLADQEDCTAAQYLATLDAVDQQGSPVGVIPVSQKWSSVASVARLLRDDPLQIDLARTAFRLTASSDASAPGAPPVLGRARHDGPEAVAEDLSTADLLCVQGHSNPVDGGFGRWLTLCSRHLHTPGKAPLFPCFVAARCFRQSVYGRPTTSSEGLVDPATLHVPLLVLDGCSTIPVPGALFGYESSIARSLSVSQVRAAVATHGLAATPLSAFVVFLATLAAGRTLGEAVRETNLHVHDVGKPSSLRSAGAGPWIVLGNPGLRVAGLRLVEPTSRADSTGQEFTLDAAEFPERTGAIVSLFGIQSTDGPFEATCSDGRWARGALLRDGRAYVWVAGREPAVEPMLYAKPLTLALRRQSLEASHRWRRMAISVHANREFLERLATTVTQRGADAEPIRKLSGLWGDVTSSIAAAAAAVVPNNYVVAPPATEPTRLVERIELLDQHTTAIIADAVHASGVAKLFHLWPPVWLPDGTVRIDASCACGGPVAGIVRRHAVFGHTRILLSCPGCGPMGDVSARTGQNAIGDARVTPTLLGIPRTLFVVRGGEVTWPVRRIDDETTEGFACAVLIDAFRERHVVTEVYRVPPRADVEIPIVIPSDWPEGISAAVVVVAAGGELSFLTFDVVISGAHDVSDLRPLNTPSPVNQSPTEAVPVGESTAQVEGGAVHGDEPFVADREPPGSSQPGNGPPMNRDLQGAA